MYLDRTVFALLSPSVLYLLQDMFILSEEFFVINLYCLLRGIKLQSTRSHELKDTNMYLGLTVFPGPSV